MKFVYTIIFIAVTGALVYFAVSFIKNGSAEPTFVFKGPEEVLVGVPFELEVKISNSSKRILRNARLSLVLPAGVVFVGQAAEENLMARDLGDLGIGGAAEESFKLMVIGGQSGDTKDIEAAVDYKLETLNFKRERRWQARTAGPAIMLTLAAPDKIAGGGTVNLKINYQNISGRELDGLFLEMRYPDTFQYQQSTLLPDEGNNYWRLGGLRSESNGGFSIVGRLIGLKDSVHSFKARLGFESGGQSYVLDEQVVDVALKTAPVSLEVLANEVAEYTAVPGELIHYSINYHYLNEPPAGGAMISAKLEGAMFEENKTLTWQINRLKRQGTVEFSARVRDDYPIRRLGDRNFVLSIKAQIDDGKNAAMAKSEVKVAGRLDLREKVLFRDAASGVLNKGPFPPEIGRETQYSVHWELVNYSNDVRQAAVRASLPPYVRLARVVKDSGGKVYYDKSAGEVVWEIGQITATRGMFSPPLKAIFQIAAAPSSDSQSGRYLPLIGGAKVSAIDEFAGFPLSASVPAVTTRLADDPTVSEGEGKVW